MATATPDRPRTRAKKACLACNARRVRCNVLETQPCHNCVTWNLSCEIGISRRGKYPRRKTARSCRSLGDRDGGILAAGSTPSGPRTRSDQQGPLQVQSERRQYAASSCPAGEDTIHRTVFLGESSPLTCVVDEGRRSPEKGYAGSIQQRRLHYSISEIRDAAGPSHDPLGDHGKRVRDRLLREGALVFPSLAVCDVLLQAYFEWFHPCFPILDRVAVQDGHRAGTISPLLLQAMLFIGVSLCSDNALGTTGYLDRYQAKGLFYQRAKEIYDIGWETDTAVKLQSLFLMSFWRGGATEERDVRFWLGAAISLAQRKGMHVMSKLSFLSSNDQKIWKRIWWALYVRDQQTSAALGLPSRIRDEDCEVVELEPSDFEEEEGLPSEAFRKPPPVHVAYVIGMAQLARLLREVVSSQYLPRRPELEMSRPMLQRRLLEWESNLPMELQFQSPMSRKAMFLSGMLHMAYNNLYVLLYREIFLKSPSKSNDAEGNPALDAAARSTRILEDMLSEDLVQHGSLHLITHIFSALCIHTIQFGRTDGTARKLAEHRAKLCLLGLKELQKSWDLENWVLDLFFRCLDDRTARDLRLADGAVSCSARKGNTPVVTPSRTADSSFPDVPAIGDSAQPAPAGSALYPTEAGLNVDWYELFNMGDDFPGLAGSLSNPEYLNPQSLEFLYRFL